MAKRNLAVVLLCALAVACAVMYVTSDADESIKEIIHGVKAGVSVESVDTLKAGQIYTETPDGRMRLMDYFNNVEKEIADEVSNRKRDISSVRAQMARDFEFNQKARDALNKEMLHKMAVNAKIAKDELDEEMRKTQERFNQMAKLENQRYKSTLKRDVNTLKLAASDKREAAKKLQLAVTAWQTATATWASATNAKIDQSNKHVAANAAQIKENAKKARKDLEGAMSKWDAKIANFRTGTAKARSKLGLQFEHQHKTQMLWASNKVKALVSATAAQFRDVENKMANNRMEIDRAIKAAATRFDAALNAQKALDDSNYASTVKDIGLARKEAKDRVAAAKKEFKVNIIRLRSVATEQNTKVNKRITDLAGVEKSNAAEQAKVNAETDAELKRLVKLGTKRYKEHLKNDAELKSLIARDKAVTNKQLDKLALGFTQALASVRRELAKERKHAESQLNKATAKVYTALAKQNSLQAKKNAKMEATIRRVRLDSMNAVREAKAEFKKKIFKLSKKVAKNDKAADKKIEMLTGISKANDLKNRRGREMLAALEEANKSELKTAVRNAIATGEKRAKKVTEAGNKMDKDAKWLLNNKLTTEISKLRRETNAGVEALALQSKEARMLMKKEVLYAIRSARKVAADDLKIAVKEAARKMSAFAKKAASSHAASAIERKAIAVQVAKNAKSVSRMLRDAVATSTKARLALEAETAKSIKKSNKDLEANKKKMLKYIAKTKASLQAQTTAIMAGIAAERKRASAAISKFNAKDVAQFDATQKFLYKSLKSAKTASDKKFVKAYKKMANDQGKFAAKLGGAVKRTNDSLAKQAALMDSRFAKTVKNLSAARTQARKQVGDARKDFATQLLAVTALAKDVNTRIRGEIATASGEIGTLKAMHARVNRATNKEIFRLNKVANLNFSESKRARGKLRKLRDENKAAAAAETKELRQALLLKLSKQRADNARAKREMAKDLTAATEKLYGHMGKYQKEAMEAQAKLKSATAAASLATRNSLKRAQEGFKSKINMLANTVAANAKSARSKMERLTGVVNNINKASALDRKLLKDETKAMAADLNKAVINAIQVGEAKAKAVQQRIAEHQKKTKRFLQVELTEACERAADATFKALQGNRQKLADNYLSFKALQGNRQKLA